jgi:DnaK suppressor protein
MANKKEKKKPTKAKASGSASKKADKKSAKKSAHSAKSAPKKTKSPVKPAPKKLAQKEIKSAKKDNKAAKKTPAPVAKKTEKVTKLKGGKPTGKPIDAIAKDAKGKSGAKPATGKSGKKKGEKDGQVKDEYEKHEEEEVPAEGALDEAGMIDLEGSHPPAEIEEDDDEVPEKRGRGRRKKNEGRPSSGNMEAYIRNRPLQLDMNRQLVKKANAGEPKPFVNNFDTRTRYSDKELAEFKELILEKLKEAQTDYDLLKQTLSNEDNHGTDDTSPSFKLLEDGSDVMSKEETAQLASRQEKYIINLKNALVRIENKSYGICRVTGKLIPKERLRSVPHATMGIDAKLSQA